MNLTGKRGNAPPHIVEEGVMKYGKLIAGFTCNYCDRPLPEAGLSSAFWTRNALLHHLATCKVAPGEVNKEAKQELQLQKESEDKILGRIKKPAVTEKEVRKLADALLAYFEGLHLVSEEYHLVQPGVALTKEYREALEIAERWRTPRDSEGSPS